MAKRIRDFYVDCDDPTDDALDDEPPIPESEQPAVLRSVDADDPPGRHPTAEDRGHAHTDAVVAGKRGRTGFHVGEIKRRE